LSDEARVLAVLRRERDGYLGYRLIMTLVPEDLARVKDREDGVGVQLGDDEMESEEDEVVGHGEPANHREDGSRAGESAILDRVEDKGVKNLSNSSCCALVEARAQEEAEASSDEDVYRRRERETEGEEPSELECELGEGAEEHHLGTCGGGRA
jgi:hypothetical protein